VQTLAWDSNHADKWPTELHITTSAKSVFGVDFTCQVNYCYQMRLIMCSTWHAFTHVTWHAISPAGASHIHRLLGCCMQKGKLRRRKDAEAQAEEFQKLTDDEKSDLVSQAIEALQAEIEQVGPPLSSMCKMPLGMWWNRGC